MSGNSSGSFGGTNGGLYSDKATHTSGPFTCEYVRNFDGNGSYPQLYKITMNISHTHNYDHKHDITADGGTEARPDNYTLRVWKRTA